MTEPSKTADLADRKLPHKQRSPWADVPMEKWSDWRWQLRNQVTTARDLAEVIDLTPMESRAIREAGKRFRFAITPYYASLMHRSDRDCPIRLQAVPTAAENSSDPFEIGDPLNEEGDCVAPGMTHRYPDRVLWVVIHQCAMFCRHCTRKRKVGEGAHALTPDVIDQGLAYLRAHPEVRDVLISGGDPLLLGDDKLENLIRRIREEVPSVEIVRLGTRTPVTMPQRITPDLVAMLRKYQPIWINTHFNVPQEFTPESEAALARLADGGFPLGNQSVLLHGVNDCWALQRALLYKLTAHRVRPYYVYQCDLAEGLTHFRTTVAKGIEILEHLRGHISGLAVPTFVVDAPEGGGKIPVTPNYVVSQHEHKSVLRNFEGRIVSYEEPREYVGMCTEGEPCRYCRELAGRDEVEPGIAGLFDDDPEHIVLVPTEVAESGGQEEQEEAEKVGA